MPTSTEPSWSDWQLLLPSPYSDTVFMTLLGTLFLAPVVNIVPEIMEFQAVELLYSKQISIQIREKKL